MTDEIEIVEDELAALKRQADLMGMNYHPNIGLDTLKARVTEALTKAADEAADEAPVTVAVAETEAQRRYRKKKEALALVRVRITCMNPLKKEWAGEYFTSGNSLIGTVTKLVPFNTEWHVPRIVLNMIKQRQYQTFYTVRDARGNAIRKGKQVAEFAVEELPALTPKQLKDLAQRQAMANGTSDAA